MSLLPSDLASSCQFSPLGYFGTFHCSAVLAVRHLVPSCPCPPPALQADWRCHSALRTALLTTPHPHPCSILFDQIVTLLASGNLSSSLLAGSVKLMVAPTARETSTLAEVRHLWTEGRYLSAYEPDLFSRGAEPINWERNTSVVAHVSC